MKFVVNIVLFLFLSFLAAPTVVSLMEDEADVSIAYSLNEEELQKELKEAKVALYTDMGLILIDASKKSSKIHSAYLQRHASVFEDIFLPPPELI